MFFLKRLSPYPLFSRTSLNSFIIAKCYTSSPSHLTCSHPDSRNVKVSVWWDLDSCTVPHDVNTFGVAKVITAAMKYNGIKGPIKIRAFGDVLRPAITDQKALQSTAIELNDSPYGKAHWSLTSHLSEWVSQNASPAHVFLITDDGFPSSLLHQLRMDNYNVMLASKESAPAAVQRSAVTIWWNWDALVRGENLTGRYYNQPPHGSWYGHYEGPIEDPEIERPAFALDDQLGGVLQQKHSKSKTHEVFSQNSE